VRNRNSTPKALSYLGQCVKGCDLLFLGMWHFMGMTLPPNLKISGIRFSVMATFTPAGLYEAW